jgi:hypothetical protein
MPMSNVRPSTTLAFGDRFPRAHTDVFGSRKISPSSRPTTAAATLSSSRRLLVFCGSGRLLGARTMLPPASRLCRTLLFRGEREVLCSMRSAVEDGQFVDDSGKELARLVSWSNFEYI